MTAVAPRFVALATLVALVATAIPSSAASDGIDPANLDPAVAAKDDFYQYAVGGWRRTHPIPADRTSWGAFDEVERQNELRVRAIAESPDQSLARTGTERRKIGDFYAACMDTDDIEADGTTPLRRQLAPLDAVTSVAELGRYFADASAASEDTAPGFAFGSEQDPKAATRVIAAVDQGGLTLPTRDYYLATDARSGEIRAPTRATCGVR